MFRLMGKKSGKTVPKENSPNLPIIPFPRSSFDSVEAHLFAESDQNYGMGIPLLSRNLGYFWHANHETINYLILPICSYFQPQTLRSKKPIFIVIFSRTIWAMVDFGNQTVIPQFGHPISTDGDGKVMRFANNSIRYALACLCPPSPQSQSHNGK